MIDSLRAGVCLRHAAWAGYPVDSWSLVRWTLLMLVTGWLDLGVPETLEESLKNLQARHSLGILDKTISPVPPPRTALPVSVPKLGLVTPAS